MARDVATHGKARATSGPMKHRHKKKYTEQHQRHNRPSGKAKAGRTQREISVENRSKCGMVHANRNPFYTLLNAAVTSKTLMTHNTGVRFT